MKASKARTEMAKAPGAIGTTVRKLVFGAVLAGCSLLAAEAGAKTRHGATHETHTVAAHHVEAHHLASRRTVSHHLVASRHEDRHVAERRHETRVAHHEITRHETHYAARSHEERHELEHGLYASRAGHENYIRHARYAARFRHSRLQCVPYAREISHIDLTGNAFLWWAEAAGRYARGTMPAEGAVLNFRAIGRMPLGHVAVVTDVINSRTILVTQANWVAGTITNDVTVQDVSPQNNWSEVEVELGDNRAWGAPYPTYGFIYNRPATDTVIATSGRSTEVAEAPVVHPVVSEAPDRNLQ